MKMFKNTILWMTVLCIVFLSFALWIEFTKYTNQDSFMFKHNGFIVNLFTGIFTSGLLVLLSSVVGYFVDKKQFYLDIFSILSKVIYFSLDSIENLESCSQENKPVTNTFDSFSMSYNDLILCYSKFTRFLRLNYDDKLIESIIQETTKYIRLLNMIFISNKKLSDLQISPEEYESNFNKIVFESVHTYKPKLRKYKEMVEKELALSNKKTLQTYY